MVQQKSCRAILSTMARCKSLQVSRTFAPSQKIRAAVGIIANGDAVERDRGERDLLWSPAATRSLAAMR